VLVLAKTPVLPGVVVLPGKSVPMLPSAEVLPGYGVPCARSGCLPCASTCTCCTTDLICLGKAFCRSVLKLYNVLCTSSIITHVKLERSLSYLLATATPINLTNSLRVMLGVIMDAATIVAVVVMVGVVFLITLVRVF
jgi:hypothetical protein